MTMSLSPLVSQATSLRSQSTTAFTGSRNEMRDGVREILGERDHQADQREARARDEPRSAASADRPR